MYARTQMAWLCLAGVGCVGWVNWQQLLIIRPQLAGLVCFVLLFAILITIRLVFRKLPDGLLTSLFFLLYAGFRIFGEVYGEPDRNADGSLRNEFAMNLSAGQFYSLFMVAVGIGFLGYACTRGRAAAAADAAAKATEN